ncbi:signal recognition particle-docking protein FtsY [uncultured Methanosphaera sp.]|uniref:signal recognition particle-docking protein FtsY n=1 Tax=uncultured Methanosphaera sp. TaxID=262501 RepID=UPI002805F4A0|nr:signal recognition particle-docking protein FtsY [uncultured Methanosphaera sp.]
MFDFIRKRLNKTIKDASDIEDEEIEQQQEEVVDELPESTLETPDESEEDKKSDDEKSNDDESNDDESKEDTEEIIKEEEPKTEEKEDKKEKKGRFSFFRRNKNKKEEPKEEVKSEPKEITPEIKDEEKENVEIPQPTTKDDLTSPDMGESQVIDETFTVDEPEKSTNDEPEEKEEKKGHFGFLHRNKNKDKKDDKKDESKSDLKYEDEQKGGRFGFITTKTIKEDDIEEILENLELSLLEGDVAFEVADTIVESVKEDLIGRKIKRRGDMELFTTNALKKSIYEIIDNGEYDLLGDIEKVRKTGEPYKIMFVGINGTGKTTTIAKLATYLERYGYTSVLGASDTFRAGAIEQLEYHAKNLNMKIIKHPKDSDPAAVAYDAVDHAKATGKDIVLIDTSGRMQTNANLMDEMKKIKRISKPDIVIYVGDALMGNDATEQADKFNEVIDIDGIILTKTDADAKGGAALSIGHVIHKPILFIGVGQGYDDLIEFKPEWMIDQIFNEQEAEA